MSNYNFYYPNRFREKTRNFDNLFNEWKSIENAWGSAIKQEQVIDKYFGKDQPNEIKNSKLFSILEYRRFEKAGSNIFHFKKELLELLEKTDVSDIQIGQIKFPYNNFYISLRELGKILPTNISKDAIIDGVYVSFTDDSKEELIYKYHISFHICGYSESKKDVEFKFNVQDIMELPSGLTFTNETATITDAIAEVHKIMTDTLESNTRDPKEIEREVNYQLEEYKLLKDNLNLMVNCLLYLSSDKPDIESKFADGLPVNIKNKIEKANTKHRRELAESEAKKFGYTKIKLVGNSFTKKTSNNNTKTSDVSPHWRRGHWRNQPFGKELTETKIIWIKPTIVNKEKGEPTKGHIYTTE
jgi:hypothetical protein